MLGIARALWGDMSKEEFKKFTFLGAILMVIIGNYWMLRSTKNSLFDAFVNFRMYQPFAKIFSLVIIACLMIGYSKLVDMFSKEKLFYTLYPALGLYTVGLSYFVAHPHLVSLSETSALYPYVSWIPGKAFGWVLYTSLEFLSIIQILFWAFIASTTKTESAKKGYGLAFFIIQIGTISAGVFVSIYAKPGPRQIPLHYMIAAGGLIIMLLPLLIRAYIKIIPQDDVDKKLAAKKKKTGFFEGLRLLLTKPYVAGVFIVATMYEVIGTVLEYQMYSIASMIYPTTGGFASFSGNYTIGVNTVALIFALLGTSFFMRKFGLRFCLLAFPTIIGFIVSAILLFKYAGGASNFYLMWALFAGMVGIKGLNYTLGNPTKETMYIPTSKDVRFKSKGWIEVFGGRSVKAGGSGINVMFKDSLPKLFLYGSIISLGLVGVWIVIASMVGNKFNRLQEENKIIE